MRSRKPIKLKVTMKKILFMGVAVLALALSSCGKKQAAEAVEAVEVVEAAVETVDSVAAQVADSLAAVADSTVCAAE